MKAENPQFMQAAAPPPAPAPQIQRRQTQKLKEEFKDDGFDVQSAKDGLMDLEEKYHDVNNIPSMSVILKEIEVTEGQIKQYQNSEDELSFFNFKKENLDFAKDTLQTNFETGILTPVKYLSEIKEYLMAQK